MYSTVVTTSAGPQLVANGSNFITRYDPRTGKDLWRLGGSSLFTAPTPIAVGDFIIVASGRPPERPIFVVRASARGDITLPKGQTKAIPSSGAAPRSVYAEAARLPSCALHALE